MTAFAQAFNAALLHFIWQGALVALALQIVLLALRRSSANARYIASCVALVALALAPVITTATLYQRSPMATPSKAVGELLLSAASASALPTFSWISTLRTWALPVWSIGVLLFSLRLVWGCRQVSALRSSGETASSELRATVARIASRLGVAQHIDVMISAMADSPSVIGWLRPAILLPAASLIGLTPEQLESVLAHELAHIRRHDYAVNLVQSMVETLLFYHPAVWWISGRIRDERELCCDDLAVACCEDAVAYARALTELEKMRAGAPAMVMAASGGSLRYRVERILGTRRDGASSASGVLALLVALACLSLNAGWVRAQTKVDMGKFEVLERTDVEYPEAAMEKKIKGTVVLEVTLDANSAVSDARVLSGPAELRRAALESVLHWRFVPSAANGVRNVSIDFEPPTTQTYRMDGRGYSMVRDHADHEALLDEHKHLMERQNMLRDRLKAAEEDAKAGMNRQQQIEELRNMLDELKANPVLDGVVNSIPGDVEGNVVERIEYYGLSDEIQENVTRSLPLRIGDTLTHEKREAATEAIAKLPGRIEIIYHHLESGRVAMVIAAPGTRTTTHYRIDRKF